MEIMPSRYQQLQETLVGYEKTGIELILYDGEIFKPSTSSDDIGIYYFVPKIAHLLNINIDQAIDIFFGGMIVLSLVLGIIGVLLLFKTRLGRSVAIGALLLLSVFSFVVGGLYAVSPSITVSIVPLFLYLTKRKKVGALFFVVAFLTGIGISTVHILRGHAGTAVFMFMIAVVVLYLQAHWKKKALLVLFMVVGLRIPIYYFGRLVDQRDAYLEKHQLEYKKVQAQHPFWDSVYIGFGFLNNKYGITYDDKVGFEKARSISPEVALCSQEYEVILRKEVFRLIKGDPFFAVKTLFAKMGVIIFYLLVFANIGLVAAVRYPKVWSLELAFWIAMGFNALFGILIMPRAGYLSGFGAFAMLYGIVSINQAIERGGGRILSHVWNLRRLSLRRHVL